MTAVKATVMTRLALASQPVWATQSKARIAASALSVVPVTIIDWCEGITDRDQPEIRAFSSVDHGWTECQYHRGYTVASATGRSDLAESCAVSRVISALMPFCELHIAKTTSPYAEKAGEVILLPKRERSFSLRASYVYEFAHATSARKQAVYVFQLHGL